MSQKIDGDDVARVYRASHESEPRAAQSELERAKDLLVDRKKNLVADITVAYSTDFLWAAAVFSEQDAQLYHGLRNDLKGRGVAVSDWDGRVRQVVRKRAADKAAADEAARAANAGGRLAGQALVISDIEPWDQPVDIKDLLNSLVALLKRFLILPPYAAEAIALYIVHTYALDASRHAPRLALISPEMECGKTTTIELIKCLAYRPIAASNISPAAIYRVIDMIAPTLMLDELDRFLGRANANPGAEEIIGILNSGHARGAHVIRTASNDHEPRKFRTFASIVFASIRALPETWASRSIIIPMRRKKGGDNVESFDSETEEEPIFRELARKCARWTADNLAVLKTAKPEKLPELKNRAFDNWRPLLNIADLAGAAWSLKAREAAKQLSGKARRDRESSGVQLLRDLRDLVAGRDLGSKELCARLAELEERPWGAWGKARKPISQHQLAEMLSPYGISPKEIWLNGKNVRGYEFKSCADAFERYLSSAEDESKNPALAAD